MEGGLRNLQSGGGEALKIVNGVGGATKKFNGLGRATKIGLGWRGWLFGLILKTNAMMGIFYIESV